MINGHVKMFHINNLNIEIVFYIKFLMLVSSVAPL